MSMYQSYTDLRNKLRENISVGAKEDDRATNQKVRLLNDDNIYWGRFEGAVCTDRLLATGGAMTGVELSNCVLKDESGAAVNVSDICTGINELMNFSETLSACHLQNAAKIDAVSASVEKCMRYAGEFTVEENLSVFKDLFAVADSQLSCNDRVKCGQMYNVSADFQLSVENTLFGKDDFLLIKNDQMISDLTSADIRILYGKIPDFTAEAGNCVSVDGRTVGVDIAELSTQLARYFALKA